jgi:hypothetical protein
MVATGTKVELVEASGVADSRLAVPAVSGSPMVSLSSAEIQAGQPSAVLRPVSAVVGLVLVVAVPAAVLSVGCLWSPVALAAGRPAAGADSGRGYASVRVVGTCSDWPVCWGGQWCPGRSVGRRASWVRLKLAGRAVCRGAAARAGLGWR